MRTWTWYGDSCWEDFTDGNELAADLPGLSVLVSAYLYGNPPGRPGPVTRLWSYRGGVLRPVTCARVDALGISLMAWYPLLAW